VLTQADTIGRRRLRPYGRAPLEKRAAGQERIDMRRLHYRWAIVGAGTALAVLTTACGGGDDTKTVTATD